jgi:hypothetical protein
MADRSFVDENDAARVELSEFIAAPDDFFGEGLNVNACNHGTMRMPSTLTGLPRKARCSPTTAVLHVLLLQRGIHSRRSKGLRMRE